MRKVIFSIFAANILLFTSSCGFVGNFWSKAKTTDTATDEDAAPEASAEFGKRSRAKQAAYNKKSSVLKKQPPLSLGKQTLKKSSTKPGAAKSNPIPVATERKVEILWQVPTTVPVKYHVFWGKEESNLASKAEVAVDKLSRSKHPVYGDVFRFVVSVPTVDRAVFFSIQAENEAGLSDKTPVRKVDIEAAIKPATPVVKKP